MRWEAGVGFRTVLRQSNCKEHSKRVHELQERADLFSSELQHPLSPLTNITRHYTAPSHPLGARKVIRARMWFLAVQIFPAPHSRVNKGHRETLPSHHKTAETAARASRWHTQECAGAPAPAAAASGSRGLASGSDHPLLVKTRPIGFLGLGGHLSCLRCRWQQPSCVPRTAQPAPLLAAALAPPSSGPRGGVCRLALP